jgi:hypothetical protein
MDLYHYPDHVRAALLRLLAQDQTKEKIRRLVQIPTSRIQVLEDGIWDVWEGLDLDTAEGEFLERIGNIVGESRQGRPDDIYRLWIRARGRANRSAGTVPDMLGILQLILPENTDVEYIDVPPEFRNASAQFMVYGEVDYPDQVRAILQAVVPAGVQLDVGYVTFPIEEAFTYDTGPAYDVGLYAGVL